MTRRSTRSKRRLLEPGGVKRYRHRPYNLGRFPSDERERLRAVGETLVEATPLLVQRLTPEVLVREIERRGEGAWAERRWLEDYRNHLAAQEN